jgi:hypothetical protein
VKGLWLVSIFQCVPCFANKSDCVLIWI